MQEGIIVKALSGFYYVENDNGIHECRGRGLFRKQKISPLVGDHVFFEAEKNKEGYVYEISDRKNILTRPPVANIDQAFLIFSAEDPAFSTLLLDRFLVHMEAKDVEAIIVVNKMDLANEERKRELETHRSDYESAGYPFYFVTGTNGKGLEQLSAHLKDKLTIVAGQSGVGKSTLLNSLDSSLSLKTGEISTHLGRGKHTTRHVELIRMFGGLIADTPGFSSLDFQFAEEENLDVCFPEMRERLPNCKFRGCTHRKEPGCAVKAALLDGEIADYRYKHYVQFFEEISKIRRY
ncbi:ribosome small subunit-dependent GTPase A [Bacillus piscicola]|uniref:ribosome small subunit-dependent GTPase A n=1 Tax=Bacillus piscicola TaxID=1632684 RepID=UPI001F090B87|nr:ribosome small subunit-dependent GTPase A [Bacillus piscicola]